MLGNLRAVPAKGEKRGRLLGPRSVRAVRDTLRAALNDALADDLIARNVAEHIKVPKAPKPPAVVLTIEQARALLEASRGTRFEAFVAVGLALGLRLGEALGLRWRDVDLDARRLTVAHQLQNLPGRRTLVATKTDAVQERELPPFAVAALRRHRASVARQRLACGEWHDHDLVLPGADGRPWAHQSFRNAWFRFLEDAGVAEHWNPHDLRRSCNTLLLAAGVPPAEVMRYVGHQSIEMTMTTYNRLTQTTTAPATIERLLGESAAD
jgi:integrase